MLPIYNIWPIDSTRGASNRRQGGNDMRRRMGKATRRRGREGYNNNEEREGNYEKEGEMT